MFRFFAQVQPEERRETLWAGGTIFLVLVAHALLETARDAMFLSHLPASQLPWVYLALAGLGLLFTRVLARSASPLHDLRDVIVLQILAAAGTFCFLFVTRAKPPWALYGLYIWGGLAATLILTRFWLLLSDRFTPSQAKRLFPLIAAGPLLGSLVGYGIAGLVSRKFPPGDLLGISAAVFLLSAGGSIGLWRRLKDEAPQPDAEDAAEKLPTPRPEEPPVTGVRESVAAAVRHPYVRRVALLLLIATVTVTLADFVFKSVVARSIPPHRLGVFFAVSYFAFDAVALVLLLTAVGPMMRARGVIAALAVEPALLLAGGVVLTAVGSLLPVVFVRGIDGALRWSLHKTATELLYVPLPPRLRGAVKALSDIVAQRGGQALGSLVILGWLSVTRSEQMMGPVIVLCAGLWLYLTVSLRRPYLDLFRETLSQGSIETRLAFPDLDMGSLETLITALSSQDDNKVLAAMYLLEKTGRTRLVPALILYHPSSRVVVRALEQFTTAGRDDFLGMSQRLLQHPDGVVRAATMRAWAILRPDADTVARAVDSESPSVAVTALVVLTAHGRFDPQQALARLEPLVADGALGGEDVRPFIARALRDHPSPAFGPLLTRLAAAGDLETRREAVQAMGVARDEEHLPVLVALLAARELREAVRQALIAFGEPALEYLKCAMSDLLLARAVRIHLPRTLSRFPTQEAVDVLLHELVAEPSGTVRYKILRGLGRLIAGHPELRLAAAAVDQVVDHQLRSIVEMLHWRLVLQGGAEEKPERHTTGHELLIDLLQQKEAFAIERLFRALGLRYRGDDLPKIYDGLQSRDAATRSSSRELLHGLLEAPLREAVVGLVDEVPDAARLAAGEAYHEPVAADYESLLTALVGESSTTLSAIAAYHAAELGLTSLRAPIEARHLDHRAWVANLRQRSLDMLDARLAAPVGVPRAS